MNKHLLSWLLPIVAVASGLSSAQVIAAKVKLQIVSLSYKGKCVRPGSVITVNLNRKITRGYSLIAISGNNLHHHAKIIKWPFRANSIKVLLPSPPKLKPGKRYKVSVERRLPHKTLSNRKSFRICRK